MFLLQRVDLACAEFLCVQTAVQLPMLGIFMKADVSVYDHILGLYKYHNRVCTES